MSSEGRVAIVDDDAVLLDQLVWTLKGKFEVLGARDAVAGLALLDSDPDLFLVDLRLPPSHEVEEGLGLIQAIRRKSPDTTVVVMTGEPERRHALRAMELGVFDFFQKPVDRSELMLILGRALERRRILLENRALKDEVFRRHSFDKLVGSSAPMRQLFRAIEKVAPADAAVLVYGESGAGKELVAQSIHRGSRRSTHPFVAVNSSALPEGLAESELFGHERGAFTGAVTSRPGKFELAHRGTLFLDEVATLSAAVQAKLLRSLETREIERVGGKKPIPVDIRLVAATNEDLEARVKSGSFREDLFYRINTVLLRVPPLRERPEDLPLLVDLFASRFAARHGKAPKSFSGTVLEAFARHPWRGNVRELEHLVEMLTLMTEGDEITPEDLPGAFRRASEVGGGDTLPEGSLTEAVTRFERDLLIRSIQRAGGVKAHAAQALGLDANQMKYLCRKYRL